MTPDQEKRLEEIRASPGLSGTAQQITRVDLLSIVDAQAARIKELEEALRALCARYERDGDSALGESLCELLALVQGVGA